MGQSLQEKDELRSLSISRERGMHLRGIGKGEFAEYAVIRMWHGVGVGGK